MANAITLARLLLTPALIYFLLTEDYRAALWLFVAAALSDVADGFIARHFDQQTRLGEVLDPLADKLLVASCVMVFAGQGLLPLWLAGMILARDVLIIGGALGFRHLAGSLEIAPTLLSKLNTALQLGLIALVLLHAAERFDAAPFLPLLTGLVALSTAASGAHYVWVWGRRAKLLG